MSDAQAAHPYLTIIYDTPSTAASGQIWDIDGNGTNRSEQWIVKAFSAGTLVATDTSPLEISRDANSLDGLPWIFNLTANSGFDTIKFFFTGSKTSGVGLGFDNFNTTASAVPEPAALGMFGLGLVLIGPFIGFDRRRRTGALSL